MAFRSFNPALADLFKGPLPRFQYNFKHIARPAQCQQIIDKLDLKSKYPGEVDIIDIFSGYGLFSSMVNYELKPRKHVIIEDTKVNVGHWTERIQHLKETTGNKENFILYPKNGYNWDTYDALITRDKIIEPKYQSRDKPHDELLIIGNITPAKFGEPLFAQWIMCCVYKNWLQKYGRVRMLCFVPDSTAMKFMSGASFSKRNKSSVKREMFTDGKLIGITAHPDYTEPDGLGYDPRLIVRDQPVEIPIKDTLPVLSSLALLEIVPRDLAADNVEMYEHITKALFYNSSQKVIDSLSHLGPGAKEDLALVIPNEILQKSTKNVAGHEWKVIFDAYEKWPFKPSFSDTIEFLQEESRNF